MAGAQVLWVTLRLSPSPSIPSRLQFRTTRQLAQRATTEVLNGEKCFQYREYLR
jgi:hypothetical protein